jgi:hypothetical protein
LLRIVGQHLWPEPQQRRDARMEETTVLEAPVSTTHPIDIAVELL